MLTHFYWSCQHSQHVRYNNLEIPVTPRKNKSKEETSSLTVPFSGLSPSSCFLTPLLFFISHLLLLCSTSFFLYTIPPLYSPLINSPALFNLPSPHLIFSPPTFPSLSPVHHFFPSCFIYTSLFFLLFTPFLLFSLISPPLPLLCPRSDRFPW